MLDSIELAVVRQAWGQQEELLASLIEVTHALLIAFLRANTDAAHMHLIPAPVRIPRPNEPQHKKPTWLELAKAMTAARG